MEQQRKESTICKQLPNLLSSFIDSFVDFSVTGFISPHPPNPNPNSHSPPPPLQTTYPSPHRLIAIGDLHGDMQKSKQALTLAGLINSSDRWTGADSTVVQIGDVLDRGGDELKILYLLERLKVEAAKSGGNFITMHGNHEIMNVEGDFRYVTKSALDEFVDWAHWYCVGNDMKSLCLGLPKQKDIFEGIPLEFKGVKPDLYHGIRARIAALRPNGPIASRFLSRNVTVLVIGDSVFVHGGLLAKHVEYGLERINEEVRDWVNGLKGRFSPGYCRGRNSVVWLRKFSDEAETNCDCSLLEHALATIPGAKRMIMGHTIQKYGINGVCNNGAIRIDVGMSKGCGNGLPEVLEISRNSELRVLTSNPAFQMMGSKSQLESNQNLGMLLQQHAPKQVEVKA